MNLIKITFICLIIGSVSFYCQTNKPQKKLIDYKDCNQKDALGHKYGLWIENNGVTESYYKNDSLDGIFKVYNTTYGKLTDFGEYKNGKPCGSWYHFNEKGQLLVIEKDIQENKKVSVKLLNGDKIILPFKSYLVSYYPNGNIEDEGFAVYEAMEIDIYKIGIWKYYDEKGKLIKTVDETKNMHW